MNDYISREAAIALLKKWADGYSYIETPTEDAINEFNAIPAADVQPVCDINKIIDQLQEKADLYAGRAKELLEEEDGQVSQYTWAVSLRETYRRVINMLEEII